MDNCILFEEEMRSGIPHEYRTLVEHALRSFHDSQTMLVVFKSALTSLMAPATAHHSSTYVVAIGSYGRLDGSAAISDYDIMYLYDGVRDTGRIQEIRELIRNIVSGNQALHFDHRFEIENGTFDFDASPAYPVLSTSEVLSDAYELRALQLLTEGRCVLNKNGVDSLRGRLLTELGYADNINTVNMRPLREALQRAKVAFCTNIVGRLKAERRPLANRKILKLFALREFFYLATLFSIAEVELAVAGNRCSVDHAIHKISSPSIVKVSSFGDGEGLFAALLRTRMPALRREIVLLLKSKVSRIPAPGRTVLGSVGTDPEEISLLRAMTLSVLNRYNALLQLLHDPGFLEVIDRYEPDYTTWIAEDNFRVIKTYREELIETAKIMADAAATVLRRIADATGRPVYERSIESLNLIGSYELQL